MDLPLSSCPLIPAGIFRQKYKMTCRQGCLLPNNGQVWEQPACPPTEVCLKKLGPPYAVLLTQLGETREILYMMLSEP